MQDAKKAKEWAGKIGYHPCSHEAEEVEVAKFIFGLPDQIIDANKLREALDWRDSKPSGDDYDGEFYDRLRALLPAPQPRTLAVMTPEERKACKDMQAKTWHEVGIIVWVDEMTEIAQLITRANGVLERKFKDVTPLPGLPKLEWPGDDED